MFKFMLLACATWASVSCQGFDYYYDDLPVEQVQARPPPPRAPPVHQTRAQPSRNRSPPPPPPPRRPVPVQQVTRGESTLRDGPTTTPVPILIDTRRIDTKTGAFVYEYAGADGSEKYEIRYPNGTVQGTYSFINALGEKVTREYSAGNNPNHLDETLDPNYVDLSNYDLYKHLEVPYVHIAGPQEGAPRQVQERFRERQQSPRLREQVSRPAPRPSAPRPPTQRAQVPLDFNDEARFFEQAPATGPVFDYEDVALAPVPAPVPVRTPVVRGSNSRGRPSERRQQAPQVPRHHLGQNSEFNLDSIIQQFQ